MDGQEQPVEISGQVKWFDPAKGFGFVLDAAGGPDVLLHANVLRNFGQSTVAEGTLIRVLATPTARGLQASQVLEVQSPATSTAPIADLIGRDLAQVDALPFQPARVKWFDRAKGFGFANLFGHSGDVFLHVEVLRHGGFADLVAGEAIAIKVVDGRRGPMAARVASWDRAAEEQPAEDEPGPDAAAESTAPKAAGPVSMPVIGLRPVAGPEVETAPQREMQPCLAASG